MSSIRGQETILRFALYAGVYECHFCKKDLFFPYQKVDLYGKRQPNENNDRLIPVTQ